VLNSINEPTEPLIQEKLIQEKPQEEAKKQPDNVVPIDKAVKQSKAENTKPTSKTDKQETEQTKTDKLEVKRAEPTYPYPESNNEDEMIAGLMSWEEEREWIERNLRPLNDDFLDYF
jgi:hypothetical protein